MSIKKIEVFEDEKPTRQARRKSSQRPNDGRNSARPSGRPGEELGFLSFGRDQQYYTSTGRKVGDFFMGFIGMNFVNLIPGLFLGFIGSFLLPIIEIVLFFMYGRRWLAIGMLAWLPFTLLFGGLLYFLWYAGGIF